MHNEWARLKVPLLTGDVYTRIGGLTSGAPVVLLHGFVLAGDYMMPAAERLSRFTRTYVPDLPGYGLSDRPARRNHPRDAAGSPRDRRRCERLRRNRRPVQQVAADVDRPGH